MASLGGMGGLGGLGGPSGAMSNAEQARLMAIMQEMQMADSLRMYNELVERCFGECVDTFRTRKLDGKEDACIRKCSGKFVAFAARCGMRFQEYQQEMAQEAAKAAGSQQP
jgi:mitochondrial import inner membrane translocase subunit TIM9